MPHYYFDLVDDKAVYDKKGVSLRNEQEARDYAITFARELFEEKKTILGERWTAWAVEVSNGKFERLFKVPFTEAVKIPD